MNHKKEAKALVEKMYSKTECGINNPDECCGACNDTAKQCALIAVDREIELLQSIPDKDHVGNLIIELLLEKQQIRKEIEKL